MLARPRTSASIIQQLPSSHEAKYCKQKTSNGVLIYNLPMKIYGEKLCSELGKQVKTMYNFFYIMDFGNEQFNMQIQM